ncbi:MAG: ROK family protein [Oscillospiraceae bacterium]|nr:ROK family protein [Oscillospiraceae bacterium]
MLYLGIDLGGTGIKAGITDETGRILCQDSCRTAPERGWEAVADDMALLAGKLQRQCGEVPAAAGVGIPGAVNPRTGAVLRCVNLNWNDVPLSDRLRKTLNMPVFVGNDANVAAAAEAAAGASRGIRDSVLLTLGTGVGSGIILDGRMREGVHGAAAEIGHTVLVAGGVPCSCGKRGCVDRYCSATGLIRMAEEELEHCPDSVLAGKKPDARMVLEAALDGDPAAEAAFDRYTDYLALTLNNIIHTLDPEVIILGGGVSGAGEALLRPVEQKLDKLLLFPELGRPEIRIAALGNDAGIIGAAMLARQGVQS